MGHTRRCLGCKTEIKPPLVTCRACWSALPDSIRSRMRSPLRDEFIAGTIEAVHHFRDVKRTKGALDGGE